MSQLRIASPGNADRTLADLASDHAGASRVFARHGLDFCCKGRIPLAEACAQKGLSVDSLLTELAAEQRNDEPATVWAARPIAKLIEHIVTRYHAPLRDELPRLLKMARRVEAVHGEKESCPRGVAELLEDWTQNLMQHLAKEEEVLFPLALREPGIHAASQIRVIEQEHDDHAAALASIRELTQDHTPPSEACGTWRALFAGLAELEFEIMQHVHLENHVLFPRVLRTGAAS